MPVIGAASEPPNKYAGLVSAIDQLPAVGPGQSDPPALPTIGPTAAPPSNVPMTDAYNPAIADELTAPEPYTGGGADSTLIQSGQPYGHQGTAAALPVISPLAQSEQKLSDLVNKDYSKGQYRRPDGSLTSHPTTDGVPNEVVTAPGKDRAKKWSLGSKILNAVEGWATGGLAEGVRGATDRNYQAKLKDASDFRELLPKINAEQQIAARDAATAGAYARPAIAKAEHERKSAADTARANYWDGVLSARKARLDLSKDQLNDLTTYRQSLIENGAKQTDAKIKQIDEVIRHNQVSEKQQAANEAGRNTRANTTQAAMNNRQQITIAAQKEAAAVRAAETKGNQAEAQAARERLAKLKQLYDGLQGDQ